MLYKERHLQKKYVVLTQLDYYVALKILGKSKNADWEKLYAI